MNDSSKLQESLENNLGKTKQIKIQKNGIY